MKGSGGGEQDRHRIWCRDGWGCIDDQPGLPLFSGEDNSGHFTKIGIIVWTKEEAETIQEVLTGLYFAQTNNYDSPFSRQLLKNSFIIILQDVIAKVESDGNLDSPTIEGLASNDLTRPVIFTESPLGTESRIQSAFDYAIQATHLKWTDGPGSCGYCSIITYEILNPFVQFMLENEFASGPYDETIYINIDCGLKPSQSLNYNEYIAKAMATVLTEKLDLEFFTQSRLD